MKQNKRVNDSYNRKYFVKLNKYFFDLNIQEVCIQLQKIIKYQFHKFKMHTNKCDIFGCKPMNALESIVRTVSSKKVLSQLFFQRI